MAVRQRHPSSDQVHQSTRGGTHASGDDRKALEDEGIEYSMSRKGDCWDNAVAESFISTLRCEMGSIHRFESRETVDISVAEHIDGFQKLHRRHSALNYSSSIVFELIHSVRKAA